MKTQEKIRLHLQKYGIEDVTVVQFAKKVGVSQASISRFAAKENFAGFKELKHFYQQKGQEGLNKVIYNDQNHLFSLAKMLNNFDYLLLENVVNIVSKKQKIIIIGKFFSYLACNYLKRLLSKINVLVTCYNSASEIDLIYPENHAAYIFISFSGKNSDIDKILKKIKHQATNSAFFLFTLNQQSPYAKIMNATLIGYAYQMNFDRYEVPLVNFSAMVLLINMFYERYFTKNLLANNSIIEKLI